MGVWIETRFSRFCCEALKESHPSWVCGLKHKLSLRDMKIKNVTPFVGVWIETPGGEAWYMDRLSHPSWVCGLKLSSAFYCSNKERRVTPFVGVWIETFCMIAEFVCKYVTPFVGVWIET